MSTPFTDQFLESCEALLATDTSGDLAAYLTSLANLADELTSIIAPQGDDPSAPIAQTAAELVDGHHYMPGWGIALDPDLCPARYLPYLSQFNGTPLPAGVDEATARSIIKTEAGLQRGTVAAIIAAASRVVTAPVTLVERVAGDGYRFELIIDPAHIPSIPDLIDAVNAVKPAGLVWTLNRTAPFTWSEAIHTWSVDLQGWHATTYTRP